MPFDSAKLSLARGSAYRNALFCARPCFLPSLHPLSTRGTVRDRLHVDVVNDPGNQTHEEQDNGDEDFTTALQSSDLPDAVSATVRASPSLGLCRLGLLLWPAVEKLAAVFAFDRVLKNLLATIRTVL